MADLLGAGAISGPQIYQMLAGLGTSFTDAREKARKQALEDAQQAAIAGAVGPDGKVNYNQLGIGLLRGGALPNGLAALGLGQKQDELKLQRDAGAEFSRGIGAMYGAPQGQGAGASSSMPSLVQNESGGKWDAQNSAVGAGGQVGHFGRLQFGQARLQEAQQAGAIPPGTTPQAFMASPELQKRAEQWHLNDIDQYIAQNGLDKAGPTIGGIPVTLNGLRAVAHLGGKEGLKKFVETGGQYNPADANGTRLSDYFQRHGGQATAGMRQAPQLVAQAQQPGVASDIPAPGAQPAAAQFVIPGTNTAVDPAALSPRARLLIGSLSNPHLPEGQRKVAETLLKTELEQNGPTTDLKNFNAAQRNPVYDAWLKDQNASKATKLTIDQKGETKFAEASGTAIAKRFEKIAEDGDTARTDIAALGELKALGGQIGTGGTAALQGWLADKGIAIGPNVDKIQAYTSLVDKLTPAQRIPGTGATSDFDAKMFKSALPRIINTPGGNELITDTLTALAQDRLARAQIAERAQIGELKPGEAIKELRALPSPQTAFAKRLSELSKAGGLTAPAAAGSAPAAPAAPPKPAQPGQSQFTDDFSAVPEGSRFRVGNKIFRKVNGKPVPET